MNRSPKAESGKKTAPNVLKAFALFAALSFMQSAIGFGTNLFFSAPVTMISTAPSAMS